MEKLTWKRKCFLILEGVENVEPEEAKSLLFYQKFNRQFDYFMLSLIFLNVVAYVLESVKEFEQSAGFFFTGFEQISIFIFTIEYVLRIYCITEHPNYQDGWRGRLRFSLTSSALIDLVAFLPSFLAFFLATPDLRIIRSLRLMRLLKLWRYSSSLRLLLKIILDKKDDLQVIFFTILLLLIVSASLMYLIENEAQPRAFSSIPETMWWAVSTLTTIGYGDVYPITPLGKILGSFVALLGVALFALPAGIISAGFMQEVDKNNKAHTAQRNAEKIKKAFHTTTPRKGFTEATHRVIDLITIKSRLSLSEEDIFSAIQRNQGFRVRYKKNTKTERFSNTLVLEHFDFNRSYGCYINRGSAISIISPMSYAEHAIGHFTAHLAKYLQADYLSNELYGENDDLNSEFAFSFSKNYAFLNDHLENTPKAFLDFKRDLENAIQEQEKVFIIKSTTRKTEDFILHFGGNLGEKGFQIMFPTFQNTLELENFYNTLNFNFLSNDLQYSFATHQYFDNTLPNSLHQYIAQHRKANVVTLYIHNDIIEWTDDETYFQIIKILGDTVKEILLNTSNE